MYSPAIIYIVTSNFDVRESLRVPLLERRFDVRFGRSGHNLIAAATPRETGAVLIDIDVPESDGFGLLAAMRQHQLNLPVIFVTAHANCALAIGAMRAGAIDILERPFNTEALLAAVGRALTRGDLDSTRHPEIGEMDGPLVGLTKRERDVLEGLLRGRSNKIIAHDLGISKKTVEIHRAHLMTKTGSRTLAELMRIALPREKRNLL